MRVKKTKGNRYGIIPTFLVLVILVVSGIYAEITEKHFAPKEDCLNIYCMDVGQGDCTYMIFPDGKTMLIDAGERDEDAYLKLNDYITDKIDYFVLTHPHSDHAGGAEDVLNTYNVDKIFMPDATNTSPFYENLIDKISREKLTVIEAKAGVIIHDNDNLRVEIISPGERGYNDINNMSAVIKITYNENAFLFMGDAEKEVEQDLITDVKSDFIKVGHHGSNTSSTKSFLDRVSPKYAVISVGEFNDYNHPHNEVLKRFEQIGTDIYRTDLMGNIFVSSDGKNIEITYEKEF